MGDFDSQWTGATVGDGEQSNFDPPAGDGEYVVELVKATAITSKKGDDWVVLELADLVSRHQWTLMLGFKSQGQANITKTACSRLGIQVDEVSSLTELANSLEDLAGAFFEVTVKTNGEYRNTYIDGPARHPVSDVPAPTEPLPGVAAAGVPTERVPF